MYRWDEIVREKCFKQTRQLAAASAAETLAKIRDSEAQPKTTQKAISKCGLHSSHVSHAWIAPWMRSFLGPIPLILCRFPHLSKNFVLPKGDLEAAHHNHHNQVMNLHSNIFKSEKCSGIMVKSATLGNATWLCQLYQEAIWQNLGLKFPLKESHLDS